MCTTQDNSFEEGEQLLNMTPNRRFDIGYTRLAFILLPRRANTPTQGIQNNEVHFVILN